MSKGEENQGEKTEEVNINEKDEIDAQNSIDELKDEETEKC